MERLFELIGRLHPLVVHLPIGILFLTICIEFYIKIKRNISIKPFLPVLWGMGFLTSVLACIMGWMLKLEGGYQEKTLGMHQNFGIALAIFSGVVFFSLKFKKLHKIKFPLVVISLFLLFATGHLGGNLTHGEDYLSQPLQAFLAGDQKKAIRRTISQAKDSTVYATFIAPILETKCQKCHSSTKRKGGLNMDSPENLMKGGKHGSVLVAGDAAKSQLYARLLLPEGDDQRMPPKGKTEITANEIALIKWWINEGKADFNIKAQDIAQPDIIKQFLAKQNDQKMPEVAKSEDPEIPDEKLLKPDEKIMLDLERQGAVFSALTPANNFFSVNLVNNPNFSDAQLARFLKIKNHILWLDLSGTKITNHSLKSIAQFKNLTRLSLDNTAISDAQLHELNSLQRLKYLNLYHTHISDQGLESLRGLTKLSRLYLWETNVTARGVAGLKKILGKNVEINYESGI
ncbi:MAG: c-type cytochrome domain-containing protein [Pedobacter sp.]|nr:c-type cytochrome domain-containing protein [Pedobacter sp.]MDQ8052284.1 c-type cytochrome domain-containing protein [Pedobacter sp.]